VLEVGALDVNGNPRSLFPDAITYVGVDRVGGPNVDLVWDAANLVEFFGPASKNTVLCCEMLEHAADPPAVLRHINCILRPCGILVVTTPGNGFPEHRHPRDYWRLMPDAMREICFDGFDVLGSATTQENIQCMIGRKL